MGVMIYGLSIYLSLINSYFVVVWYFSNLYKFKKITRFANGIEPDQTDYSAASDLGLEGLLIFNKKDARFILVKSLLAMGKVIKITLLIM